MLEQKIAPAKADGAVQRWDPFGVFDTLEQQFAHFWQHPFFMRGPWSMVTPPTEGGMKKYTPRMDVYEKDGALVYKAELPGLTKEDVRVELDGAELVIMGETKAEKEAKEADYYCMERTYGSFYRRVPVPPETKVEQITATLADGVLEVCVPKPAISKPEAARIPIT